MKYEYNYVYAEDPDDMLRQLNLLGREGWMFSGTAVVPPHQTAGGGMTDPLHIVYLWRVLDETPPPLRVVPPDLPPPVIPSDFSIRFPGKKGS